MAERELLELVELCYACVADPGRWAEFLAASQVAFAALTSSVGTFQLAPRRIEWLVAQGISPAALAELPERGVEDPRVALYGSIPRGGAYSFDDSHDIAAFKRSAYWTEYHCELDILWAVVARLDDGRDLEGVLTFHRPERDPCFGPADVRDAAVLGRHVGRARRLQLDLDAARAEAALRQELLDRLPTGLVLLAADGRALEMNRAARAMLAAGDGLALRGGMMQAADAAAQRALAEMIQAAARGLLDGVGGVVGVPRPSGEPGYVLSVARCFPELARALGAKAAVVVSLAGPARAAGATAAALRRLWDLTAAEAQLALALAGGATLKEVAARAGISLETARVHLKRTLAKSGTHRQSELVRLILTGPGSVLAGDAGTKKAPPK